MVLLTGGRPWDGSGVKRNSLTTHRPNQPWVNWVRRAQSTNRAVLYNAPGAMPLFWARTPPAWQDGKRFSALTPSAGPGGESDERGEQQPRRYWPQPASYSMSSLGGGGDSVLSGDKAVLITVAGTFCRSIVSAAVKSHYTTCLPCPYTPLPRCAHRLYLPLLP